MCHFACLLHCYEQTMVLKYARNLFRNLVLNGLCPSPRIEQACGAEAQQGSALGLLLVS